MIVVELFLVAPWVFLQFVIVVFPDHTHLLFLLVIHCLLLLPLWDSVIDLCFVVRCFMPKIVLQSF